MKTLLCSQKPPLQLSETPASEPKSTPILHPKTKQTPTHHSKTWKLQANVKGFAGRSSVKERPSKAETTKKYRTSTEDEEELPREVFYRIIYRILFSVGVPLALGIALLHIFGLIKEHKLWDIPPWIPFMSTLLTFGASTLGIAYGALSASMDPKKKGSFLGLEEVPQNWAEMWRDEEETKR